MKEETMRKVLTVAFLAVIVGFVLWRIGDCKTYNCDVKVVREAKVVCDLKVPSYTTKIAISKGGKKFATVSGEFSEYLNMYDMNDNKIASADHNLFPRDSHVIYEDGEVTARMYGAGGPVEKYYDIYNKYRRWIGIVTFNLSKTNGVMYDDERNVIAEYKSKRDSTDFKVRIKKGCQLSDKTVLMIFCSYYDDNEVSMRFNDFLDLLSDHAENSK